MGTEMLLAVFGVGALCGWVLLAYAERYRPHGWDDSSAARVRAAITRPDRDEAVRALADLGLTLETCHWIYRTMTTGPAASEPCALALFEEDGLRLPEVPVHRLGFEVGHEEPATRRALSHEDTLGGGSGRLEHAHCDLAGERG